MAGSGPSVCTATPLCMWHGITIPPDSYINIQIVIVESREKQEDASIYSINVPNGPDPYHLAPVCATSSKLSTKLLLGDLGNRAPDTQRNLKFDMVISR